MCQNIGWWGSCWRSRLCSQRYETIQGQRLRFLGMGGCLTLLCELSPDKINSDESGRWFKVTDKYPSDRCVPRSVLKRLKEVGQSSKERKKWLIMLWYVVFSETAEKIRKDWKRRKIWQESTDVIWCDFLTKRDYQKSTRQARKEETTDVICLIF